MTEQTNTQLPGSWGDAESAAQETAGSGGIIALTTIEMGYKIYTGTPSDQSETFVAVPVGKDEKSIAERKAKFAELKAKALADGWMDSKGKPAVKPQFGVQMTCELNGAYSGGKEATWKGDRHFNIDQWTSAYGEAFVPAAIEAGILEIPWKGWLRVGFTDDPYGTTETDQNGETRTKQVAVPREVFASKDAAMEAVARSADGDESVSTSPPGYTEAAWSNLEGTIVGMLKEKVDGGSTPPDAAKEVATQWSVDEKFILPLIAKIS